MRYMAALETSYNARGLLHHILPITRPKIRQYRIRLAFTRSEMESLRDARWAPIDAAITAFGPNNRIVRHLKQMRKALEGGQSDFEFLEPLSREKDIAPTEVEAKEVLYFVSFETKRLVTTRKLQAHRIQSTPVAASSAELATKSCAVCGRKVDTIKGVTCSRGHFFCRDHGAPSGEECPLCDGTMYAKYGPEGPPRPQKVCESCGGDGYIVVSGKKQKCTSCGGTGTVPLA